MYESVSICVSVGYLREYVWVICVCMCGVSACVCVGYLREYVSYLRVYVWVSACVCVGYLSE